VYNIYINEKLEVTSENFEWILADYINIFGHSHNADLDFTSNFINTGSIMCKHASYLLIDDEDIRLEKTRY